MCVSVCVGGGGHGAEKDSRKVPAMVSGWQRMCRKEDAKGPRDGEMASCFSYSDGCPPRHWPHSEAGLVA